MANTIKLGNGNWATKEGSLLAYNDERNNFKPLPFTTTRASSATVVNKQGLIETVGSGIPRIDFSDDANGALLLEPFSRNLVTYSEDFTQWVNTRSSDLSGFISPTGGTNGTKVISDATVSSSHIIKSTTFTIASGQKHTYSVFVKANQLNFARLMFTDSTVSNYLSVYFDLLNGTVGTSFDAGTATLDSANIENFGNGWYRCSISGDLATTTTASTRIYLAESDNVATFDGDGIKSIYAFGAQVEQNSYATSYIKNEGTALGITRVADTASGAGNSTVINSSEGVFYAEMSRLDVSGNESAIFLTKDSSNEIRINLADNNRLNIFVNVGGVYQVYMDNATFNLQDYNKIAVKYKLNDYSVFVNGTKIHTDTSATVPPNMDELKFNNPIVKTKSVQVYNTALTDAELTTLTTI